MGITEARGRLMERNGEDYICPNCTAKKNQLVRPATAVLSAGVGIGKPKTDGAASVTVSAATLSAAGTTNPAHATLQSVATPLSSSSTVAEERSGDDQGIKGRIEKATNPTGKKRIKIFQPVCPFHFQ